jgi:hypothetical protein
MTLDTLNAICARRGLKLLPHGQAWRVTGPGVDILFTEARFLIALDLDPSVKEMPRRR